MRGTLISLASLLIFSAAIALLAQDESAPQEIVWASRPYSPEEAATPQIRVQSNLVEVSAVVLDRHDRPVPDLKKSDFLLFADGKPQEITNFSVQTAPTQTTAPRAGASNHAGALAEAEFQPRSIALFFDDVNARFPNVSLRFAREAAMKFVRKGLDPAEKIGIFTASGTLQLDFTDNVEQLYSTLDKLRVFQRIPDQGMMACPPESQYQAWVIVHIGGMTNELKAAMDAARDCCGGATESCARTEAEGITTIAEDFSLGTMKAIPYVIRALARRPGSRVLLLTSSGFLTQSFAQEREKVIEAAIRGGVVINSLDTRGVVFDDRFG
ncbi:MAG TPA: VWA domain-containing protein, partial [Candidatus Acidoferrales bacterium]|nr:VWA domain-containing protein [Candidatus Acidoferrales bacterium]